MNLPSVKTLAAVTTAPVARFGSALKAMAEAELEKLQALCFGTKCFPSLKEEIR